MVFFGLHCILIVPAEKKNMMHDVAIHSNCRVREFHELEFPHSLLIFEPGGKTMSSFLIH